MKILEIDDVTLTHLLGYLKPSQWADTLKNYEYDKELIRKLMKIQKETYGTDLQTEVKEILKE